MNETEDKLKKKLLNKKMLIIKKRSTHDAQSIATYEAQTIRYHLESLEGAYKTYVEVHEELASLSEDNEQQSLVDELESVSEIYISLKADFSKATTSLVAEEKNDLNVHQNIKLPPINLPQFGGNLEEWYSFKDQFESIVHNNISINDTEKMFYLKTCLVGQAATIISSLSSDSKNYMEAWRSVVNRYDNKYLVFQMHMHNLFAQTVVQQESVTALKNLIDTTNKHIRALNTLGRPTDYWDDILVHLVSTKLPTDMRKTWEIESISFANFPTWTNLSDFIAGRVHALEVVHFRQSSNKIRNPNKIVVHASTTPAQPNGQQLCHICSQQHSIYKCSVFMRATVEERRKMVSKALLCWNCLRSGHQRNKCVMDKVCKVCQEKHHTLLHLIPHVISKEPATTLSTSSTSTTDIVAAHGMLHSMTMTPVLLSTALVRVHGSDGRSELCRALLDSASQSHFVSCSLATRLGLKRQNSSIIVGGISNITTQVTEVTSLRISSRLTNASYMLNALIAPRVTVDLPTTSINIDDWTHLQNVALADPQFYKPGKIDLLIGAEIFMDLVKDGKIHGPSADCPTLQNSTLGWIVCGRCREKSTFRSSKLEPSSFVITCHSFASLDIALQNFWELEEVPHQVKMSSEDQACEKHFIETHKRDKNGRYVLQLPFKEAVPRNNSYALASQRLLKVERLLSRHPDVACQYREFMLEYELLGHMEKVLPHDEPPVIFIPHHHISRPSSSSTKLRVVFDGSTVMDSGKALNDYLYRGPKLQRDIVSVINNFRLYRYVFSADIKQMFRQISVHKADRKYQCILWRANPVDPIQAYRLNTITYGLITSPYQAIRTLRQLANDESATYPVASSVLCRDFYVDEVMTGRDSVEELTSLQQELISLLDCGGFSLRKWASNCSAVLEQVPIDHCVNQLPLHERTDTAIKLLGISWNASKDTFSIQSHAFESDVSLTKRQLLSEVARVYDPCGWLAPLVVVAKLILQRLWRERVQWDEKVSDDLMAIWNTHRASYIHLDALDIPRYVNISSKPISSYTLHGFCDSSEQAYAAVLYLVATSDVSTTTLLVSKTRVAPLKKISIPRLELCGAFLLAQLVHSVVPTLHIVIENIYLWSDSTITLWWIASESCRWNTFVANRVSQIQQLVPEAKWKHVKSGDNPADLASRGLTGNALVTSDLWWQGPDWLKDSGKWPIFTPLQSLSHIPEERLTASVALPCVVDTNLILKYSSLESLLRVIAYIFRFTKNCKVIPKERAFGFISVSERRSALNICIKLIQSSEFSQELDCLGRKSPVRTSSVLKSLHPFVDNDNILRVGGRLDQSELSYEEKHPIILPKKHHLTELIIRQVHLLHLHSSLNVTMSILRQRYWIIHARSTIKRIIHQCVTCHRFRSIQNKQIMASLPKSRVTVAPPFTRCGVDYAGPFVTRLPVARIRTTHKSYLALFVCLTTKAVHLELVSDLSTNAFLAALRRFVSRRGCPQTILSDNGTNFVGAQNTLRELHNFLKTSTSLQHINAYCLPRDIEWKFIPPSTPHFGGLWEANIKSCKSILKRITKTYTYTQEELGTLFCQIESIMNSRPLCALSTDCHDYSFLTPGHFLIGRPVGALSSKDFTDTKVNRLTRWNLLQKQQQQFWKLWSADYLVILQNRYKWQTPQREFQVGDLVVIKDERTSPNLWPMARIIKLHPSSQDHRVRVVTVKTEHSTYTRPITKLIGLPIVNDE